MDRNRGGGIISGFLGTSNPYYHRNNDIPSTIEGPEVTTGHVGERRGAVETPNEVDIWSSSPRKPTLPSGGQEKPRLHRRGSYIDWGAGAFDFSNTSTGVEFGASRRQAMQYKRDARRASIVSTDGTLQIDILPNQNNKYASIERDLRNVAPNMAIIKEDTPVKETKLTNVLARIDENVQDNRGYQDKSSSSRVQENDLPHPPKPSDRSLKRRQSILDIVEDQKIEAAPRAFLYGEASTMIPTPTQSVPNSNVEENGRYSLFGGLINNWFFKNEDSSGDDVDSVLPTKPQIEMEGIGEGKLTSKVISALQMNPTTRIEGGKMNTWMPASF